MRVGRKKEPRDCVEMLIQPILKRQEEREDSFNGRRLWYIVLELKYVASMMDEKKTLKTE